MKFLVVLIMAFFSTKGLGQLENENMEQRLTMITLGVLNLQAQTDFYEAKFGWKKERSSNGSISFFTLNGIQLALYGKDELAKDATVDPIGNGFKGFTISYNTTSKNEVDRVINTLRKRGVEIVKEPQDTDWGGYSGYITDLEGNLWEIAFNPYLQLDKKGNIKK